MSSDHKNKRLEISEYILDKLWLFAFIDTDNLVTNGADIVVVDGRKGIILKLYIQIGRAHV